MLGKTAKLSSFVVTGRSWPFIGKKLGPAFIVRYDRQVMAVYMCLTFLLLSYAYLIF
ncbi:Uncharacterized protein dnm_035170 [Desulfonema magnum]|uniref:Uncharacterized protein n=1 Tax=Desulfonema magnum TaxID=45655 RepID=A0A975BLQ4_9BACT|nr:Uncharacterized protein dnm_035170 [Desulfonema magnum]